MEAAKSAKVKLQTTADELKVYSYQDAVASAKEYFKGIAARYVFSEEIANFKEKLENNK